MSPQVDVSYTVEIHHEDGSMWATVEQLPGLFVTGATEDELQEALAEAIGMYLSVPGSQCDVVSMTEVPGSHVKVEERRYLVRN